MIDLLFELNREAATLVLVTHDPDLAVRCGQRLALHAGPEAPVAPEGIVFTARGSQPAVRLAARIRSMSAQVRRKVGRQGARRVEQRLDVGRQQLAELDAPLVERIDVPQPAERRGLVLVEREQRAEARRVEAIEQHETGRAVAGTGAVRGEPVHPVAVLRAALAAAAAVQQRLALRERAGEQRIAAAFGIVPGRHDDELDRMHAVPWCSAWK